MISLGKEEIEALIDLQALEPLIAQSYRDASQGLVNLPPVGHISFPGEADCHIKYGHRRGAKTFVIKIATGFPQNATSGVPAGGGLSLVLSAETGAVEAILNDEMTMTDYRTAVGSVIAAKALAAQPIDSLLILGTGMQARRQIEAFRSLVSADLEIKIWGRSVEKAKALAQSYCDCQVLENLEAAVRQARLIVTATGAFAPLMKANWVEPGTHICAVGADAPGKGELETALLARADVLVADSRSQCLDHGELCRAPSKADVHELGAVLSGAQGRTHDDQISIADLTGIAAQDLAIAAHVLQRYRA